MRIKITQVPLILEGWANRVKDEFNLLDPERKSLAEDRLLVCNSCKIRDGGSCSPKRYDVNVKTGKIEHGCGCNIAAKTLSPKSECPLGYWKK